jgi:hypothetical protein
MSGPALPPVAQAMSGALEAAVRAATAADRAGFEAATARLAALPAEPTGLLLGAVLRALLEDTHPDGVSADDLRDLLRASMSSAARWCPGLAPHAAVAALAGALGVHDSDRPGPTGPGHDTGDPDDQAPPPVPAAELVRHAPVLLADLLPRSRRGLRGYLDAAFAEIARAETVELP